ncbi:MAG: sigma 54-interacting transcriptional regulator [Desulfobacula sp.]|uniref:sigma-54 interaction domain-containing protein n=1 Tax=Desulfobacula sp. TaxID=2593537 RepID=UPI0025B7E9CA|nr:sigma 54-interacting transcriptional regulator [Desulfobacula sp.]MCD4721100.1 sigma 54-interacting transcriptional regulator [Desulfobacula sp.]
MKSFEEVPLLYEISEALNQHMDMKKSLFKVLSVLSESLNLVRGIIFLINSETGEIRIEIAHGISEDATRQIKYLPGEGIIGKVIQSGEPAVVPRISEEPLFLDKTHSRGLAQGQDYSYICVPIKKGNRVVGAISADRPFEGKKSLEKGEKLLSVVAAMVAHHVINIETIRVEKKQLKSENIRLKSELENRYSFTNIIGNSNKMREVFQMISQVSSSFATVLIRGESGTGKELVANSIHYNSDRNKKPFIKINCAAIPENLIESELFGHEKGAFTGASRQKKGKFEMANQGTIFLDEIGNMTLAAQVKLLRVLQEKEFERVGGYKPIKTDVRIVAATNSNLEEMVQQGKFRDDLYFRLNVFPIYIPSLRMRKTDIILLADHFLEKYSKEQDKNIKRITTPAIDMMMEYHWPGNVRELENCIERAVILCNEGAIHSYHLPATLQTGTKSKTLPLSLENAVAHLEREILMDSLKNTRGNINKAAGLIGITVRKFSYKAVKYDINYKDYR